MSVEEPSCSVCMSECEGAADAVMMLIIHTVDVRPAAEVPPLGNVRSCSSFIVIINICGFCRIGCVLQDVRKWEVGT